MDRLDELLMAPFYFREPGQPSEVIGGGKPAHLLDDDLIHGISRFGGPWRHPSYAHAYGLAAKSLLAEAKRNKILDELGLPIFYMQRHAMELLIKQLVSWMFEIAEYRAEAKGVACDVPTSGQKKASRESHNLARLLGVFEELAIYLGFPPPPQAFAHFVQLAGSFERSDTWARYGVSNARTGRVRHVDKEILLPVVQFQELLETALQSITGIGPDDPSYEYELYNEWSTYQV